MGSTRAGGRDPRIERGWKRALEREFAQPYVAELKRFLLSERSAGRAFHPAGPDIFRAFELTPFDQVRVVIIGQDPYHGPGQAHGLCFSVPDGVPLPPSLKNIFRELQADLGVEPPATGNLESWARQGVLLLNATLTVGSGRAGSHRGRGWEQLTDAAITALNEQRQGLVFMLWGRDAQRKAALIDEGRHHVLRAAHPSPLSAHNGFFGCRHFSRANELLKESGQPEIRWGNYEGPTPAGAGPSEVQVMGYSQPRTLATR